MTAPTRATHQRICHREGRQARGDLPVQFYGYMGTNVEATPYREIPTDGIAVLGMTYFSWMRRFEHILPVRLAGGQ